MKNKIAIVLTFIFILFIITPTIFSAVKESIDISILLNVSEEGDNQKEISKTFDLKIIEIRKEISLFNSFENKNLFDHNLKRYVTIFLENISPPPEFL